MDAFYASVEQRDSPALRGQPVIVAWKGRRSVVCAASYEARAFGVRSAMPLARAERLCPVAAIVPPNFEKYREVSKQIRDIFLRYTDLVEPLSLDEAYLDMSKRLGFHGTATAAAARIRSDILAETGLTASAGVSFNKLLAKIASDLCKPNGCRVIRPQQAEKVLAPLPVTALPGVGPVTADRLGEVGIRTVGDLQQRQPSDLAEFGSYAARLQELAFGIDTRPVEPSRPSTQISVEDTFESDLFLDEIEPAVSLMCEKVWQIYQQQERRVARTVVLKLKTSNFKVLTRSITPVQFPTNVAQFTDLVLALREKVNLPPRVKFRLAGVALTGLCMRETPSDQPDLFAELSGHGTSESGNSRLGARSGDQFV